MSSIPYRRAAAEAAQLLILTSGNRAVRYAAPDEDMADSERAIGQALAQAQFVLNHVCMVAIRSRIQSLNQIHRKQRSINLLHLLTGSGFAVLLTNHFQEPMKWIGAFISFGAAGFGLWLPSNVPDIEKSVFDGSNRISSLSGEIARIETELILKKGEINDPMAERIANVIAGCREEAVKWNLGQIAAEAGIFPPAPTVNPAVSPKGVA